MKITKWMRFALIALSVVMALSLFACGDPEETTTAQKEETSENKTDATTESKGTEATDSESTEPDKETTDGDVVTTEGDTDEVTTEGDVVTTEGTTESGSETTESGSETTDTESESETTETETESVETTEAPCEHVPVEDAAVKPTCTETGLTKGSHCEKCGEILVAQEVVPTRAHDPKNVWEYAANPDGDTAVLVNPCADCGAATETKAASFQLSVEGIFGGEAVYTFQASETVIPLMGTEMLQFNPDHPNYPADGYTPVPDGSATGFGNLFGIAGWAGYVGSTLEDGASYKIVDLEGNVLVEWTAVKGILAEAGLNVTSAADPAITEFLAANYTDGATAGFRFYHIVSVSEHINEIAGKTVNVTFAFNATAAAEGATYIPYATLQLSVPECAHTNCTVYEAKDPACDEAGNDYYKVCALCQKIIGEDGTVLEAAPIIPATGHAMGDDWAVDPEDPQNDFRACSVCGDKEYRPATTTLEGLTLLTPEYLASMPKHDNIESVSVETDENGMKYYHAVGKAGGKEATLVFNSGAEAMKGVGNYIAMIMRKSTGTASVEAWVNNAGTVDHTDGNGTNTSATVYVPIKSNGEWQLVIFDYTGKTQMSVENGIGWARLDVLNGTIVEGETIDIAYAGFFSSVDAIIEYYGAYVKGYFGTDNCFYHVASGVWAAADAEGYRKATCTICGNDVVEKIPFTVNLDKNNSALNGTRGDLVAGGRKTDEAWVIDASGFTLNTVDAIAPGGWFVTPEGTAKYEFRVVSVDGVAVENPTLVEYFEGGSSGGITAVGTGRGWTEASGQGAAWQTPKAINLAGYEGKTVNVEVVATTTYGAKIVIMQINNITVPAAQ